MNFVAKIGIIGAMSPEVENLIAKLENRQKEVVGSIEFHTGTIYSKNVVVAQCGIGKVFAAICAQTMILKYSPELIVNTGVGGAVDEELRPLDIVFADKLVEYDMDTSPLGDPVGMISGINKIFFESDEKALKILEKSADEIGLKYRVGTVATGDKFVSSREEKEYLHSKFSASACEMEGGAIAQTAYVNNTPFAVVRAISDSANGEASMDYMKFLPQASKTSTLLTLSLIKNY